MGSNTEWPLIQETRSLVQYILFLETPRIRNWFLLPVSRVNFDFVQNCFPLNYPIYVSTVLGMFFFFPHLLHLYSPRNSSTGLLCLSTYPSVCSSISPSVHWALHPSIIVRHITKVQLVHSGLSLLFSTVSQASNKLPGSTGPTESQSRSLGLFRPLPDAETLDMNHVFFFSPQ